MGRTSEKLATSDEGVILYRRLPEEQLAKVERGEDPLVRDPARDERSIEIPRERVSSRPPWMSYRSDVRVMPPAHGHSGAVNEDLVRRAAFKANGFIDRLWERSRHRGGTISR